MSELDAALHSAASEIQESVLESEILVDDLVSVDYERQCGAAGKDFNLLGLDLDLSCVHVRVDHVLRAESYKTRH